MIKNSDSDAEKIKSISDDKVKFLYIQGLHLTEKEGKLTLRSAVRSLYGDTEKGD